MKDVDTCIHMFVSPRAPIFLKVEKIKNKLIKFGMAKISGQIDVKYYT
jgi:hypothetical protein